MADLQPPRVAIVDYGMGNLFSVKHACEYAGMSATVTSDRRDLLSADGVILPGVGAYGDAMAALQHRDLVGPLQELAQSGKILVGICLGMQLLMTESHEFGDHRGLGIIEGPVVRLAVGGYSEAGRRLKVPQVGWNQIRETPGGWQHSPLAGLSDGEFMFFVHSYYAMPEDSSVVLSTTRYGELDFCSGLRVGNVFGFQFHPERSGPQGLRIYQNLALMISGKFADKDVGAISL